VYVFAPTARRGTMIGTHLTLAMVALYSEPYG
jgi:hypothetical protein